MARDFLQEIIEESTRLDSEFPSKVVAARERRVLARQMAERRKSIGLTQSQVARKMQSTQPEVSKVESGGDVRWSTLERYAAAIGGAIGFIVGGTTIRRRRRRAPTAG